MGEQTLHKVITRISTGTVVSHLSFLHQNFTKFARGNKIQRGGSRSADSIAVDIRSRIRLAHGSGEQYVAVRARVGQAFVRLGNGKRAQFCCCQFLLATGASLFRRGEAGLSSFAGKGKGHLPKGRKRQNNEPFSFFPRLTCLTCSKLSLD